MANSQHRCVFVGNIPYDATEEQLKQICEEVGPVVSFRLVIDRETGKPKGYGFCEYKDEETALSARRNLQGYEINGRQLRVDFAENDKNAEKPRDQGRGGPGMVANSGPSKQFGGPAIVDSSSNQPIGLQEAMAAASVMAGVLGGSQVSREMYQNGFQGQPGLFNDPLTLHLAKMSKNQLSEVISELKVMAAGNKEQARQLLLATPQLSKAFFQAQIMLGMVTPQMLQMPNIRQTSGPPAQPLSHDGQQGQQPGVQSLPGKPPLSHNNLQSGLVPRIQEPQLSSLQPNSLAHNQYSAVQQHSLQPNAPLSQLGHNQVREQGASQGQSRVTSLPVIGSHPLGGRFARPETPNVTSSYVQPQMQPPSFQHQGPTGSTNSAYNGHLVAPNAVSGSSLLTRVPSSNPNIQVGRIDSYPSSHFGSVEKANMLYDTPDPMNRPSKMIKLEDGKSAHAVGLHVPSTSQVPSSAPFRNHIPKVEEAPNSERQTPQQLEIPAEMLDPDMLEQLRKLTREQLSSLPPDQQQLVFQLQQMLR